MTIDFGFEKNTFVLVFSAFSFKKEKKLKDKTK